jgi:hypothetical protein
MSSVVDGHTSLRGAHIFQILFYFRYLIRLAFHLLQIKVLYQENYSLFLFLISPAHLNYIGK